MVDTLKQTVCKGATDAQFRMFVEVCKSTGLNPFLKEIWYVPSVGVMAGRDGYLRVANEHPQFDGMETRVERDDKGVPIKAICSVYRKDRGHPITCEAYYSEYRKSGNVWSTYPSAMISKVAEVLALKRGFAINGIVTEEEIGTTEERGSKEAQQDVAQRRIKELSAPSPQEVQEAIASGTTVKDYEQRHTAMILEANAVLDEVSLKVAGSIPGVSASPKSEGGGNSGKTAQRKRGAISFTALKQWGEIKKEILALTGTTELYYKALSAGGYQHADEIKTQDDAAKIWKALKAITAELAPKKQAQTLEEELRSHEHKPKFMDTVGAHGFESVGDVIERANGTQLGLLLAELRLQ